MRTADLSATTLSAYSSAESRVDHLANSCVPPVTEPFPAEDSFLGEQTFGATVRDEHLFQPAPLRDLLQLLTSFAAQRKLIVGTAVVATLTVGAMRTSSGQPQARKKRRKLRKPLNPHPSLRFRRPRGSLNDLLQHQLRSPGLIFPLP
jgi:hypothetical protein